MVTQKLGRYEIVSKLGRGTMGTVYKAVDPVIERTVAIKAINLDLPKDEFEDFEERFYREAKSAGRLNHPNIVTIYDVGKTNNVAYIAMEFLEGQSLREILKSGTSLSHDRISEIAAQIADGLAYAQRHDVVHRDIKPANIMITNTGQVKITDFGIAHLPSGSKTATGTILGSPKYMSPEQIVGKPVDGRSDIFSLGVVLYEMVTGRAPFDGETISTIMYRILNETPVNIRTVNKRCPIALEYVIYKSLAKHPVDRYQNASELAHDLRNYKTLQLPPPAQLATMKQPPQKTLERRVARRKGAVETTLELPADDDKEPLPSNSNADAANQVDRAYPIIELPGTTGKDSQSKTTPVLKKLYRNKLVWTGVGSLAVIAVTIFVLLSKQGPVIEKEAIVRPDVPSAVKDEGPGSSSETKPSLPSTTKPEKKTLETGQSDKKTKTLPALGGKVGYLKFEVTPKGEIFVDGNRVGISPPLKKLPVTPGKHRVEVKGRTPPYYTYDFMVNVEINQSTMVRAEF